MDLGRQRELLPHYVGILVSIALVLVAIQTTFGDVGVPGNLAGVVAVVLVYPTIVRFLGLAPSSWEH